MKCPLTLSVFSRRPPWDLKNTWQFCRYMCHISKFGLKEVPHTPPRSTYQITFSDPLRENKNDQHCRSAECCRRGMTGLPLWACGAKWRTHFNDYLMALNTSSDVLLYLKYWRNFGDSIRTQGMVLGLH